MVRAALQGPLRPKVLRSESEPWALRNSGAYHSTNFPVAFSMQPGWLRSSVTFLHTKSTFLHTGNQTCIRVCIGRQRREAKSAGNSNLSTAFLPSFEQGSHFSNVAHRHTSYPPRSTIAFPRVSQQPVPLPTCSTPCHWPCWFPFLRALHVLFLLPRSLIP